MTKLQFRIRDFEAAVHPVTMRLAVAEALHQQSAIVIDDLEEELFAASWERMVLLAGLQQFSVHTPDTKEDQQPYRQWLFNAVLAHNEGFQKAGDQ